MRSPHSATSSDGTTISANGCCTRCSIAHLGGIGDESSAGPRADLRDAIEQADRIAGDGMPTPDEVRDLIAIAEAHCDTEERTVLPLLRRRLDPAQLDEMRDALAEAAHESDD